MQDEAYGEALGPYQAEDSPPPPGMGETFVE